MKGGRRGGPVGAGLLLVGLALFCMGAGSAVMIVEIFRHFARTWSIEVLLAAAIAAMLAGGIAMVASWRGLAGDLHWPGRRFWTRIGYRARVVSGALLLSCGLGLLAIGGFALAVSLTPVNPHPEPFDIGVLMFWSGVAIGGLAALLFAAALIRQNPS